MSNQAETLEVNEHELEQYEESRWSTAFGLVEGYRDELREYLRYYGADSDAVEKAEDEYVQLMRSDAANHLYELVERALPDTLQEFVTALREKSND